VNTSLTGTTTQKFVTQVYRDLLGRDPDPGGLSFFTSQIDMNLSTRTQVAEVIETSPEGRMHAVNNLFQTLLGRPADPTGLDLSVRFLNSGGSLFQLEATIAGSPEYLQRAGGTNDTFLTAVYQDALGRPVDSVGQSLGSQALNTGTSRTALADTVFASQEGLQQFVQNQYSQFLNRSADPVGLNASTTALQLGVQQSTNPTTGGQGQQNQPASTGASTDDVIAVILGSDEFLGRL
jgi:hypothetical protein